MDFLIKVIITIFIEEILVFIPLVILFFYSIHSFIERNNFAYSCALVVLPLFYIFYHYSYLPNFFSAIGQDSLAEINADFGEAIFYLKTFFSFLLDPEIFKRNRFWLLLISSFSSSVILYFLLKYYLKKKIILNLNKYFNYVLVLSLMLGLFSIIKVAKISFDTGKELKVFENEFRKNILNFSTKQKIKKPVNIVIYLGESTTALNLSLYGYPFNTSPWLKSLKKNDKFIKFSRAYSTHTHTTPSLLSAFSLCIRQSSKNCSLIMNDIENNLSIIDVLNKSEINTYLYSTQGSLGGHNLANKLVFNTKDQFFSIDKEDENSSQKNKKLMGDRYKPKIKDHEFFVNSFCNNQDLFKKDTSLTILHSYAGHGQYHGYLKHVPKEIEFSYPKFINEKNFLGKDFKNFRLLKEYDTAIKYIDSSLEKVFECSNSQFAKKSKPMIFIYFSDHGESPATGRGHDSTRLTYEMLHIPLIVHFNDAAYKLHKDKFEKLNELKDVNLSSKFISDLILYFFEVDVLNKDKKVIYESNKFKSLSSEYILDRKDLDGNIKKIKTFWNYENNYIKNESLNKNFSKQDTSINLWQLNNFLESRNLQDRKNIKNLVCKHRANSFITQYKASLSNGCFETDIIYLKDKTLSAHEIQSDTNLIFNDFTKSNFQKNTVWLDSKNIHNLKNCEYSYDWVKKNSNYFLSLLVETPSPSIKNINNQKWKDCIQNINKIKNVQVGYYMPTHKLNECSTENINQIKIKECEIFLSEIEEFLNMTKIKSITFDYSGYEAINKYKNFKKFKWHIWHVDSIKSFNKIISNKNIGIILLRNNKFSNNLN